MQSGMIAARLRAHQQVLAAERTGTLARFCRGILTLEYQNDDQQPGHSRTALARPRGKRPQSNETVTRIMRTRNRSTPSQSSQSDSTRSRTHIRAIRARIRARNGAMPVLRARPITRSTRARTAASRTRIRPAPPKNSEGTSKDTKNTKKTKTKDNDDSERTLPAEVEIYLGSAKKSAGGSQSGGMEWEETESKILSSDEESKVVKRQKLDSGIGEETTPPSDSSPAKTETKTEPPEAEAGTSDTITVIGRRRLPRAPHAPHAAPGPGRAARAPLHHDEARRQGPAAALRAQEVRQPGTLLPVLNVTRFVSGAFMFLFLPIGVLKSFVITRNIIF